MLLAQKLVYEKGREDFDDFCIAMDNYEANPGYCKP
jgi:hypothetical protein